MVTMLGLVAGFVVGVALSSRKTGRSAAGAVGVLGVTLLAAVVVGDFRRREPLPLTDFDLAVRATLEARGEGDAMIVVPNQQETLQARLGHPVMADLAGFNWIPYKPSLGPAQYKVYRDFYGINFAPRAGERPWPAAAWAYPEREVWPRRSEAAWRRLAAEYDFRYVVAPDFIPLRLPEVLSGDGYTLYDVGDPDPAAAP
jgi:hypothetical protein